MIVYLPKKALKTKSNFFLRNSDNGIFGTYKVKKRERDFIILECMHSINIRSRSSGNQGRLFRATDSSFISRVKSKRVSLECVCVYQAISRIIQPNI